MGAFIGLIRGVNVGGTNMVKMADLRAFLTGLGLDEPQTLLQSGNFVVRSDSHDAASLEGLVTTAARAELGLTAEFYVRTVEQWTTLVADNPFPQAAVDDPSHLLVTVFHETVAPALVQTVRSNYDGPEEFAAVGDRLYATFPLGIGPSKLSVHRDWKKLTALGTGRNWNTVLKLAEMVRG